MPQRVIDILEPVEVNDDPNYAMNGDTLFVKVAAVDLQTGKQLWEAPAAINRLSIGSKAVITE